MWRLGSLVLVGVMSVGLMACARHTGTTAATPPPASVGTPPPADSPFAKIEVGMSPREVEAIAGPPTDENSYITGKAFIPFFYGRDRWRRAYFYKGQGRVVFAGGGGFSGNFRVHHVEYDPSEMGRAK